MFSILQATGNLARITKLSPGSIRVKLLLAMQPVAEAKSALMKARPVYLSREDHIEAHFLICFVALVIARLLVVRLGNKFSIPKIVESLNRASGSRLEENWFVFNHTDEVTSAVGKLLNVDLSRKYLKLAEIKKILGATKKS